MGGLRKLSGTVAKATEQKATKILNLFRCFLSILPFNSPPQTHCSPEILFQISSRCSQTHRRQKDQSH